MPLGVSSSGGGNIRPTTPPPPSEDRSQTSNVPAQADEDLAAVTSALNARRNVDHRTAGGGLVCKVQCNVHTFLPFPKKYCWAKRSQGH